MTTYYHFLPADRRLSHGDGRKVEVGQTLKVRQPAPYGFGFRACRRAIDALARAPGPIACKVALGGVMVNYGNLTIATERTAIAMVDATDVLRRFARLCALDVADLWDATPEMLHFLRTGKGAGHAHNAAVYCYYVLGSGKPACDAARAAVRAVVHAAHACAAGDTCATANLVARDAREAAYAHAREAHANIERKQNRRLTAMLAQAFREQAA